MLQVVITRNVVSFCGRHELEPLSLIAALDATGWTFEVVIEVQ